MVEPINCSWKVSDFGIAYPYRSSYFPITRHLFCRMLSTQSVSLIISVIGTSHHVLHTYLQPLDKRENIAVN